MKVGIIGCGAAGMMAAITAARNGHKVTVFEHGIKPGKKILATGNGRCNFTNELMGVEYYNESAESLFSKVYDKFTNKDTIDFFERIGIMNTCKNGYYYPRSEQATAIVNGLTLEMKRLGIVTSLECNVISIDKKKRFVVKTDLGFIEFDKLIIATGSKASPKTGSDGSGYYFASHFGHDIIEPLPALCALECKGFDFKKVAGVRCKAKVLLNIDGKDIKSDTGEVQLVDYGISGIPVFQISSQAVRALNDGKSVKVNIDFLPEETAINELYERILALSESGRYDAISELLSGMLNDKLSRAIVKASGINDTLNDRKIDSSAVKRVISNIKKCEVTVKGYKGFDNCQVCSGGVPCNELNSTLESKIIDGLYFAGEIIDVNGICGGYNLQWAWSSGYVAGLLE